MDENELEELFYSHCPRDRMKMKEFKSLDLKDENDCIITKESNIDFIKNKIQESITYMNLFQNFLENVDENNKDLLNADDYNTIAYILSQLDPILNDKEILDAINNDINKRYNIDSLTQLIEVQLALSDKIRELIK